MSRPRPGRHELTRTRPTDVSTEAEQEERAQLLNLDFVTDRLATGGDLPEDTDAALAVIDQWRQLGITHVVDTRFERTDEDFVAQHAPEIHYMHLGVDDAGQRMPNRWFDQGTTFVAGALAQPDAKVLVHCHMGINRGPSLTYAALLDAGWDPIDAITVIRAARPIAAVGYAEDALDWHHHRTGTAPATRAADRERLRAWRDANWLDVHRIIRSIRAAEAS
jgi:dual specificity phosphatase 3